MKQKEDVDATTEKLSSLAKAAELELSLELEKIQLKEMKEIEKDF